MKKDLNESTDIELIKDQEAITRTSSIIFPILKTKDEVKILTELYKPEYKNIDLTLCIDTSFNNNTILLSLVYYNLTSVIKTLFSSISSFNKSSSNFISYINQQNIKGYNAILYSAYRGNIEIFKKLLELGADINMVNSSGLNVLHLAVQGNHPNIIVFLMQKCGFNINSKDNNGSSALHWGVNMNSRESVDYLVYYNIDINLKDKDGETALSIAKNKGNEYFIKKFNDDFSILNNNKDSEENKDEDKSEMENNDNINNNYYKRTNINNFFNKFWGTKSVNMAAFPFILMMFALEGTNQMIIIKGYNNLYMSFVFFILFFLLLFFYYIASKSDPGEVEIKYVNSLLLLAEQGEEMKNICPWCISNINENTYHCFLCSKCFNDQEFHDIYLNNCIGKHNFWLYLNFLYYSTIVFSFKFCITFWGFFWLKGDNYNKVIKLIVVQSIALFFCIIFFIMKIKDKSRNKSGFMNFEKFPIINLNSKVNDNEPFMNIEIIDVENS